MKEKASKSKLLRSGPFPPSCVGCIDRSHAQARTMHRSRWSALVFNLYLQHHTRSSLQLRFLATSDESLRKLAIVGGGLAGLSTAFHLLEKTPHTFQITIIDKAPVGQAGASSVAGGYVQYRIDYTRTSHSRP